MFPSCALPDTFADLFARVSMTRQLTAADRHGMMVALCKEALTDDEIRAMDRIFYGLRHGQLHRVDDLSAVF